jgi:hypothetical protein
MSTSLPTLQPPRLAPAPRLARLRKLAPVLIAGSFGLVALIMRWHGSDFPAQFYRAHLFAHYGFVLWNNQWYGGHPVLDYGIVAPVLGALIGPVATALVASLAAAIAFDRLAQRHFGPATMAGVWFAVATVVNVVVGRVPFAVGLALALFAVLALDTGHRRSAVGLAVLTTIASSVAGVFLLLALVAWALTDRSVRRTAVMMAGAVLVPMGLVAMLFSVSGSVFPYQSTALKVDLLVAAAVALTANRRHRVIHVAAALYIVAALIDFAIANPLGGNISRLTQFIGAPLLVTQLWRWRPALRWLIRPVTPALLIWQLYPAYDGVARAAADPSTVASYYQDLTKYLSSHMSIGARVEIPFTKRHWEAAYVADKVPLARGWERQIDIAYNKLFYDGSLSAQSYRTWLANDAIEYVALADAKVDYSAEDERALLETNLPYLTKVWNDDHWTVWKVNDFTGVVDGPATLTAIDAQSFTLDVHGPGPVIVRIRASSHWGVSGGGCAATTKDGWIELDHLPHGTVTVKQGWTGTECPTTTP